MSFFKKLSDFDSSPLGIFRGCHVTTVEGIGTSNKPHPVQRRVAELHGSQSLGEQGEQGEQLAAEAILT